MNLACMALGRALVAFLLSALAAYSTDAHPDGEASTINPLSVRGRVVSPGAITYGELWSARRRDGSTAYAQLITNLAEPAHFRGSAYSAVITGYELDCSERRYRPSEIWMVTSQGHVIAHNILEGLAFAPSEAGLWPFLADACDTAGGSAPLDFDGVAGFLSIAEGQPAREVEGVGSLRLAD